ncbi:MAG: histidine phosphatase family protein [Actinomycetota bacterium]|nr:histidine phosphatase family protein [Actinomycetota bacterium]MDD5600228.1 histidine phosphatase family protein [Actinomycetota bacterium]
MDKNQKVVFLIRHGNTEYNEKKLFRGRLNIPLNSTGIEQAEKTGKFLKGIKFDLIYSSPLRRAYETAEIIKKYQSNDMEVLKEEGFTDVSFGEWEGKSYDEIQSRYPEFFRQWMEEPYRLVIPGGETLYDAQDRSWETLKKIISEESGQAIAIVTHRMITKLLISKILDINESGIWKINQDACCINIFDYMYETFFVSKLNYNFHIVDIKESFFRID